LHCGDLRPKTTRFRCWGVQDFANLRHSVYRRDCFPRDSPDANRMQAWRRRSLPRSPFLRPPRAAGRPGHRVENRERCAEPVSMRRIDNGTLEEPLAEPVRRTARRGRCGPSQGGYSMTQGLIRDCFTFQSLSCFSARTSCFAGSYVDRPRPAGVNWCRLAGVGSCGLGRICGQKPALTLWN
jgi:hypothetical protein